MFGSLSLHVQVLADGEHAAQTTHDGTACQAVGEDCGPDGTHRHQRLPHDHLPHAAQAVGGLHHIRVGTHGDGCGQRAGDQAHGQTFHHEGQGDQPVGGLPG